MNIMEEKLRAAEKASGKSILPKNEPEAPRPANPNPRGSAASAYPPRDNSAARGGGYSGAGRSGYSSGSASPAAPMSQARPLPLDYVDAAEKLWSAFPTRSITTSKLRNILSLLTDIYNEESIRTESELTATSVNRIQLARVRMIYESGRDPGVKSFIEKANLIPYMKDIGTSRAKALNYIHYIEALVAYHRYFGGKS